MIDYEALDQQNDVVGILKNDVPCVSSFEGFKDPLLGDGSSQVGSPNIFEGKKEDPNLFPGKKGLFGAAAQKLRNLFPRNPMQGHGLGGQDFGGTSFC